MQFSRHSTVNKMTQRQWKSEIVDSTNQIMWANIKTWVFDSTWGFFLLDFLLNQPSGYLQVLECQCDSYANEVELMEETVVTDYKWDIIFDWFEEAIVDRI